MYVRIRLVEKVKRLVWPHQPGTLNLRQKLEAINDPAIDLLRRLLILVQRTILAQFLLQEIVSNVRVILEVVVLGRKAGEDVNGREVADALVEVGEDEQLVGAEARADAVELGVELGAVLAVAHLEDRLDEAEHVLGERCAEVLGRLAGGIERHRPVVADRLVRVEAGRLVEARGRRQDGKGIVLLAPDEAEDDEDEEGDAEEDADQALVQEEEPELLRLRRLGEERHDCLHMALEAVLHRVRRSNGEKRRRKRRRKKKKKNEDEDEKQDAVERDRVVVHDPATNSCFGLLLFSLLFSPPFTATARPGSGQLFSVGGGCRS